MNTIMPCACGTAQTVKMGELYPLKEGVSCPGKVYDCYTEFKGGKPTDGNVLSSIDYQTETKNGVPTDRLVFKEMTPTNGNPYDPDAPLTQCKNLGSFEVDYNSQQDDGNQCIKITMNGIRRSDVDLEKLNKSIENSPTIDKIEMGGEEYGDDQAVTLLISLKEYGGSRYEDKLKVYEVPNQGKIIIDLAK